MLIFFVAFAVPDYIKTAVIMENKEQVEIFIKLSVAAAAAAGAAALGSRVLLQTFQVCSSEKWSQAAAFGEI